MRLSILFFRSCYFYQLQKPCLFNITKSICRQMERSFDWLKWEITDAHADEPRFFVISETNKIFYVTNDYAGKYPIDSCEQVSFNGTQLRFKTVRASGRTFTYELVSKDETTLTGEQILSNGRIYKVTYKKVAG